MITPHFTIAQDADYVIIVITAPYIRAQEVDFYIEGSEFKFHLHPYFLRLHFPGNLLEDDRATASYDIASGKFTTRIPKETSGEHFPDLDLLTKLLARKGEFTDKEKSQKGPLIEIVGDKSNEGSSIEDGIEFDWELPQEVPHEELLTKISYGFGGQYTGYFTYVNETANEINDIENPERARSDERREERVRKENSKFDEEYYLGDIINIQDINSIFKFKTIWMKELRLKQRTKEAVLKLENIAKPQNNTTVKSDYSEITSQMKGLSFLNTVQEEPITFTLREQEIMRNLPRREYILDDVKSVYLGLVDLLFAYSYNHRVTEGENTVESVWTIGKLSSTISCFEKFTALKDVLVANYRRALAYPLYRNFELCDKILQDVYVIFKLGKRAVLKVLLELKDVFDHHDIYYIYSKIWLNDYCVWAQESSEKVLKTLAHELHNIKISKAEIGWDLEELEQLLSDTKAESN